MKCILYRLRIGDDALNNVVIMDISPIIEKSAHKVATSYIWMCGRRSIVTDFDIPRVEMKSTLNVTWTSADMYSEINNHNGDCRQNQVPVVK